MNKGLQKKKIITLTTPSRFSFQTFVLMKVLFLAMRVILLTRLYSHPRFTGAIRSGFQFSGVGNITVGGGDEVWVYVNRVLLLEVIDIAGGSNTPCKTIDISPAAASGKVTILVCWFYEISKPYCHYFCNFRFWNGSMSHVLIVGGILFHGVFSNLLMGSIMVISHVNL